MCGIVGYVGNRPLFTTLLDGLKTLEYRGYDSAGLISAGANFNPIRSVGRVSNLESKVGEPTVENGVAGIAHTRWATHGGVTESNAHPHVDWERRVAVVHNGIIDNSDEIKDHLEKKRGLKFYSETDTECIVQLIADIYEDTGNARDSIIAALKILKGTYGLAIVFANYPDKLWAARNGSPLVLGLGEGENWVASDSLVVGYNTTRVVYLNDGDVAEVTKDAFKITNIHGREPGAEVALDRKLAQASKGSFDTFMAKEIWEQPNSIRRCIGGRIRAESGDCIIGGLNMDRRTMSAVNSVTFLGCGTSRHAGMIGAHLVEKLAGIRSVSEQSSEFATRNPIIDLDGIYMAISQSGETYDTLECVKELQNKGARTYGIVNSVGSSIARLCGAGMYIHAGPEVAVASTKAFTSQVMATTMLAMSLARNRKMAANDGRCLAKDIKVIPDYIDSMLESVNKQCLAVVDTIVMSDYVLFIGRGLSYPVALEGALKLKEIAYIPCNGYAAGEMKHGPIAMVDKRNPVIAIAPSDEHLTAMKSNIKEVLARGATVIAIANEVFMEGIQYILVPKVDSNLTPLITAIPTQLIAYHVARDMNKDVDKPRNLAKSVCVH